MLLLYWLCEVGRGNAAMKLFCTQQTAGPEAASPLQNIHREMVSLLIQVTYLLLSPWGEVRHRDMFLSNYQVLHSEPHQLYQTQKGSWLVSTQ